MNSKKTFIAIAAVLALSSATSAFACSGSPPPHCSCQGGQWINNITNQVYNTTNNTVNGVNGNVGASSSSSATGGNATATGGAGGNGYGGAGGSVTGSGNSSNINTVSGGNATGGSVTVAKGAITGGNQKQNQSQTQSISGSGNSSIAAGAVQNTVTGGAGGSSTIASGAVQSSTSSTASNNGNLNNVGNANAVTGASTSSATADGAGSNTGNGSNNTTINSEYRAAKIPVSTAYSAGLTSGMDTCLGSWSAGGQTAILGLTFGTTKTDKHCEKIKNTHLIAEFSVPAGCAYMLKNIDGARDAFKEVGASCTPPVALVIEVPAAPVATRPLPSTEIPFVTPAPRVHQ